MGGCQFALQRTQNREFSTSLQVLLGSGMLSEIGVLPRVFLNLRRKPKGDGGKGTGKKTSRQYATNGTTMYDISRQFATFYDNFRLFNF